MHGEEVSLSYLLLLQKFWQLMQSVGSDWGTTVYNPPPCKGKGLHGWYGGLGFTKISLKRD